MAESGQQPLSYRFDDVVVERKLFRVLKRDEAKTLKPRAFDLLIYLIENRERVVEKQELFEHVWKGSFVTDSTLTQAIKEVRHAIGDVAGAPRYIRTVHKHGYRFIADVSEEHEPATTPAPCIAVLPFVNLSGTPENEYFCDGLAEDLLNSLTRVQHLRVVARTSAFSLRHQELDVREIGRRLNATTVLEGSALKAGNRLRVFTQLINAANGYHLWSERFDRRADDVFAIQDEITEAIISKLRIRLLVDEETALAKRHTENVEAYHLYLKGRYFWNKRFVPGAMQKAMENFQKAIEIDPQYALAHTGLADCYNLMGIFQFRAPDDIFPKARESAEKAVKIDDTLAEAHASLAYTRMLYGWNWQGSEREFKEALRLKPNYAQVHLWYAQYLSAMMRCDEAIAEAKRAKELDPINLGINANFGLVLYGAREYNQAIEQLEQTLALDPDFGLAFFYLGLTLVKVKRYAEAIAAYKTAIEKTGGMPLPMVYLGYAYGQSGQRAKAKELLQELETQFKEQGFPSAGLAWIHLGLGDFDKLFQCLNQAYGERSPLLFALKVLPEFDNVRQDQRFQELLHRLHLD